MICYGGMTLFFGSDVQLSMSFDSILSVYVIFFCLLCEPICNEVFISVLICFHVQTIFKHIVKIIASERVV
jgi:hypothetical protein